MPDFSTDFDTPTSGVDFTADPASAQMSQRNVELGSGGDGNGFTNTLGMALAAIPDFVDSTAASIGHFVPGGIGTKRGEVNNAVYSAIGMPGIQSFVTQHQKGIETFSGVGGMVASAVLTEGLTAEAGAAHKALSSLPYLKRVMALDKEYHIAVDVAKQSTTQLLSRGAMGAEAYTGDVLVNMAKYDSKLGDYALTEKATTQGKAMFGARLAGAAKGVRNAAVGEGILYGIQNQNSTIFTDDAAQNIAFAAVGLVGGAGLEWMHTGYQLRKFASSDVAKRAFSSALDPTGLEENRLLWQNRNVNPYSKAEGYLGGAHTDRVSSLALEAETLRSTPVEGEDARQLLANRDRLALQKSQLSKNTLQKVTTQGITTNGFTRFTVDSPGYGTHAMMMLKRDPMAFAGKEMVGGVTPLMGSPVEVHGAHMARVQERIDQAEAQLSAHADGSATLGERDLKNLGELRKRLQFEQNLTPMVGIDGEWMPITEGEAIAGYQEPQVPKFTPMDIGDGSKNQHGLIEVRRGPEHQPVTVDTQFGIHIPGGKTLDTTADHYQVLDFYRGAQRAIDKMAGFVDPIALPTNPHWAHLDMAEAILQKNPAAKIVWPDGMTRDSAQVESFAQKSEQLMKWNRKQQLQNAMDKKLGMAGDPQSQLAKLRVRFNLPRLTAYERGVTGLTDHPVVSLMRGANHMGLDAVRGMSLQDLKQSVAEYKRIGDLSPVTANDVSSLAGNSFTYMQDQDGGPLGVLLAYQRPFKTIEWSPDSLADRLAARKVTAMGTLVAPEAGPLSSLLTQSAMQDPDAQLAMQTHNLNELQVMGSTVGAAPQSFVGAVGKAVSSSDWIARDAPILLAASRVRDKFQRVTSDYMKQVVNGVFGDSLNQLKNPRNAGTALMLDTFHSYSPGWDLVEGKTVKTADGFHSFTLADTESNQARWREQFGTELPKGQGLVGPDGKLVVMDDRALDLQNRYNKADDALLDEKNTVLRANGRAEINRRPWYVPPPNTNGKYIGFVIGPDGKPVPGMGIVALTPADYAAKERALLPELEKKGLGYMLRSKEDIANFSTLHDRVQMDMINPNTTAIQPGKVGRGALAGNKVQIGAFNESMETLRQGFLDHANDVTETIFKEQLDSSKARAAVAGIGQENNRLLGDFKYRGINDMYIERLLGRSKLASSGSIVGKLTNPIEGIIDEVLKVAAKGAHQVGTVSQAAEGFLNRVNPWSSSSAASKDFTTLSQAMGQYMPFHDVGELKDAQALGVKAMSGRELSAKMNQFTAGMVLRVLETAQPIMNMAGVVNAMPAVIRHYAWQAGDTAESIAERTGHNAMIFGMPNGKAISIVDMAKLVQKGIKATWDVKSHPDFAYMQARGYIGQEIRAMHEQFGAIESKSDLHKFFTGDANITSPKNIKEALAQKGAVGWLSILSDKSEDVSRMWSHMTGAELAKSLGITAKEDVHSFAHDFANKMIANYSPHNTPEIFQGAIGTNIGLFQSFIREYYQRLARYVETKDYTSAGIQLATQSGLFGINSLPGYAEYNGLMEQLGVDDPTSKNRHNLGGAADLIQHGVLANIPTLFGAPGVNLYSRGDVNIRLPGTSLPPAINVIGQLSSGIIDGIQKFAESHGTMTHTELTEVVSNMIANRPIAGMIEQFANHGNKVDKYGQLVTTTHGMMESMYRIMGLRSQRQSNDLEAFYANKTAMQHKAGADDILRLATRAAMREGNTDALPAIFQKYLENGGDPHYFQRWLSGNYKAATSTRSAQQLKDVMNNPAKAGMVQRLLDAGVSVTDSENPPDQSEAYPSGDQGGELDQTTTTPGLYDDQLTIAPADQIQQPTY